MYALSKSLILRFTNKTIHLVHRAVSRCSSKFCKHRYTLPQSGVSTYHFTNSTLVICYHGAYFFVEGIRKSPPPATNTWFIQ